jgi:hypothetical protein
MGQRAVVLVLADICNDRTRRQPLHMNVSERLCEELDITPGTLGNILSSLAAAGFEFRVAVGEDKWGRPMFARRGRAVDYQFPVVPPRTQIAPSVDGAKAVDNPEIAPSVDGPNGVKVHGTMALVEPLVHPSMVNGPSVDGPQTTVTPTNQKMTPSRVGDPNADNLRQDKRQGRKLAKTGEFTT